MFNPGDKVRSKYFGPCAGKLGTIVKLGYKVSDEQISKGQVTGYVYIIKLDDSEKEQDYHEIYLDLVESAEKPAIMSKVKTSDWGF